MLFSCSDFNFRLHSLSSLVDQAQPSKVVNCRASLSKFYHTNCCFLFILAPTLLSLSSYYHIAPLLDAYYNRAIFSSSCHKFLWINVS